jgi:transmembrane sensor
MEDSHYRLLAKRYLDGTLTDNELEVFIHLLNEGKMDRYLKEAINAEAGISDADEAAVKIPGNVRRMRNGWMKYAAAVILLLGVATAFYLKSRPSKKDYTASLNKKIQHDALPGGNKAVLKLANGDSINLNDALNGQIARQGSAEISKVENGLLTYQTGSADTNGTVAWNTISTPRGGQYNIKLADGSMVWLNSASSITFPTLFKGNRREVQITGEVYFEVAKNAAKPFFVKSGGQTVQVLGTHFNVNAYADEPGIRTTLLEGSIRINTTSEARVLKPGQQVVVTGSSIAFERAPNLSAATAWKDGLFVFDDTDLPQLMRQIARWYNVDIVYRGKPGYYAFVGEIKRSMPLSSVLKILETSGVQFSIKEKQLIIQP